MSVDAQSGAGTIKRSLMVADQTGVDSLDACGRMAGMEDITWPGVAMLAVLVAGQALVVWIASRR